MSLHTGRRLLIAVSVALCLSGAAAASAQAGPTVTIVSGPPAWTKEANATFRFRTSEPADLECRLDSASWEPCGEAHTIPGPLGEGRHDLDVRPESTPTNVVARTWRVDLTPPSVPTMFEPDGLWQVTRFVTATWGGASDTPSGIASFSVRYDRWTAAGAMRRQLWLRQTKATGATLVGRTGRTYCLQAIARDKAGNRSPDWSGRRCFAVPVDPRSLDRSDDWRWHSGGIGSFMGGSLQTARKGAWARREVVARRLSLVVTKCPRCGRIAVSWRGAVVRTIDLRAASTREGRVVPVASFPERRRGWVRVDVLSSGKPVRLEGLGVSAV
ncbi:MAG TPA: hypothetical protein VH650_13885 [Gaiellaceae bacterium]|jgi:hypothetical protein